MSAKAARVTTGPPERHAVGRLGWLRADVLGANDGVLSISSRIIGVAGAHATHEGVIVAGLSGLVAGALSMSAGEFVSVSSQADSEGADLARERAELRQDPSGERNELASILCKTRFGSWTRDASGGNN